MEESMNPVRALRDYGQSVWLDYIRRSLILTGELQRLIDQDGLQGVTSNPSIFEKAITASTDYAPALRSLEAQDLSAKDRYERIAVRDIQDAADVLKPVYEKTKMRDGYVSLEVSPYLARDTKGTIDEARRLHSLVGRENLMIKVPATPEGIPAIRQLISEGISVNVTLLFSRAAYATVANAYIEGLEQLAGRGGDVSRVASVASFFVSRIDSAVDALLANKIKAASDPKEAEELRLLQGEVAVANAKLAYRDYKKIYAGDRWRQLVERGAQTQRLLWASTSTKNPNYRDVMYVERLIGPDTVNTIPPSTFDAFRDHGRADATLESDVEDAQQVFEGLQRAGISLDDVTQKLLEEAVALFSEAFDKLLGALERRKAEPQQIQPKIAQFEYSIPLPFQPSLRNNLEQWQADGKMKRLWAGDSSLWTGSDEANWLGWLRVTEGRIPHLRQLANIAQEVAGAGFRHIVLLGMGGSSLTPEVMKMTFGSVNGYPELCVLDSTDPAQIRATENGINLEDTLFVVSSKSGSTLEPNILQQYFYARMQDTVGEEKAGEHFIAITDPGSKVERLATSLKFRHIFHGLPSIGGRYSALSNFGLVPAGLMGVDVPRLLDRTDEMVAACMPSVPVEHNPGAVLGIALGTLARKNVDKVTIVTSPGLSDLGAWLEQLLAESTGKLGKGLIPVDREQLGTPDVYGDDRVFVYVRLTPAPDPEQDAKLAAIRNAGHPVLRINVKDTYDLGQEFFRWEIATAVAGAVIGINPFNQPDVESAKAATRDLAAEYQRTGSLPSEDALVNERGIRIYGGNVAVSEDKSLSGLLRAHLDQLRDRDYFALLAFIEMNQANEGRLQALRHMVRDRKQVATCLGFGPRFLHSTGQAYKGGPNSGVFLQITADHPRDVNVPGQKYMFGVIEEAQARGDMQVLAQRGRRVLRAHIEGDVSTGLQTLHSAIADALGQLRKAA
jgi:transaldolase/glucose-6-phosphate isomerase